MQNPPPEIVTDYLTLGLAWGGGFFTAVSIWWSSRRRDSICRLRALLLRIGYDLYHSERPCHDIIHEHYFGLTDTSIEAAHFCWWKRRRIRRLADAIVGRTGHPKTDFHCHAYPDKETARTLVAELFNLLK